MKTTSVVVTATATSLLLGSSLLALYHHAIVRPALAIGVVDVTAVYQAKEQELGVLLASGDEERQRAVQLAHEFSDRVGAALDQLSLDCACLLVARSALAAASPRALDLTPALIARLEAP